MASKQQSESRSWNRWINLVLLLVFTFVSVYLADIGFRAYERHFLLPEFPSIDETGPVNLALMSYNDGIVSRSKPENEFRVLSFGDSFTHSVMEPALSYNGIIEQRLAEALPGREIRVVNLGEPGTGPNSFRNAYQFWSQIFEHDAVLFHIFLGNDVLDDAYLQSPLVWQPNVAVLEATHPFLAAGNRRVPNKYPLRMLDYGYAAWLSRKTTVAADLPKGYNWAALTDLDPQFFAQTYFGFLDNFNSAKLPDLFPGYQQIHLLFQQAQAIKNSGVKVAIVLGPSEPMVNDEMRKSILRDFNAEPADYDLGLPARIISRLRKRDAPAVPLMDLTMPFRQEFRQSGEALYFRRNTHWDRAGNLLAGENIAQMLLQNWFDKALKNNDEVFHDPAWPGPVLVSDAEIDSFLQPLFQSHSGILPDVTGAARVMQLFDGVIGAEDNWAMAELDQHVMLQWAEPVTFKAIRVYLHQSDGRRYGFTLEARLEDHWQTIADLTEEPASGLAEILLPDQKFTQLRLTGTVNSDQASNPGNHFWHIEEIEFVE